MDRAQTVDEAGIMIREPNVGDNVDRDRECEEATEYPFNAIVDGLIVIAEAAGWTAHEIDRAVLRLAQNRMDARLSLEKLRGVDLSFEDMLREKNGGNIKKARQH